MLRPDLAKWNQETSDILHLALHAEHPRTRERFHLLHAILTRPASATGIARELGRDPHTVWEWVNAYNDRGPDALVYRRTGGRRPLFRMTIAVS